MKTILATIAAAFVAIAAVSAQPVTASLTNAVAWDPSPSPNVSIYLIMLTTNKVQMTTNGYIPPQSAIIQIDTTPATFINITNLWPAITNGTYSVFVQARNTSGIDSFTSTNLVFTMSIPPLPVRNLRLQ